MSKKQSRNRRAVLLSKARYTHPLWETEGGLWKLDLGWEFFPHPTGRRGRLISFYLFIQICHQRCSALHFSLFSGFKCRQFGCEIPLWFHHRLTSKWVTCLVGTAPLLDQENCNYNHSIFEGSNRKKELQLVPVSFAPKFSSTCPRFRSTCFLYIIRNCN